MASERQVQLTVRLPEAIHETLKEMAGEDRRTLNGEIVWLLEGALANALKTRRERKKDEV